MHKNSPRLHVSKTATQINTVHATCLVAKQTHSSLILDSQTPASNNKIDSLGKWGHLYQQTLTITLYWEEDVHLHGAGLVVQVFKYMW